MQILVLGSGGRLGTLLRAAWPASSYSEVTWHTRDWFDILQEQQKLTEACQNHDCIIVLAGITQERDGRSFEDNSHIAKAVLEAAADKRVLLASSAAVYGRQVGALAEDNPTTPQSNYGRSKRNMEQMAAAYPSATCLRIGNVAGADALLGQNRKAYKVHRFPDGGHIARSYIGPKMLAHMIHTLCLTASPLPPVLNVALPGTVEMTALLDASNLSWVSEDAPPSALQSVEVDTNLLQTFIKIDEAQCSATAIVEDLQSVEALTS